MVEVDVTRIVEGGAWGGLFVLGFELRVVVEEPPARVVFPCGRLLFVVIRWLW